MASVVTRSFLHAAADPPACVESAGGRFRAVDTATALSARPSSPRAGAEWGWRLSALALSWRLPRRGAQEASANGIARMDASCNYLFMPSRDSDAFARERLQLWADTRARAFIETHGDQAVELDALPVAVRRTEKADLRRLDGLLHAS